MSAHINLQTIKDEYGEPAFVVLPIKQYRKLTGELKVSNNGNIPNEVVEKNVINEKSAIQSWREYLGLSQRELAQKMGISQPAVKKMESSTTKNREETLVKVAKALDITLEQLTALED